MDTNEMIALLLPPNGCFACSDTRKEIAEELARRSVDLERECADADKICAALGLTVDKSRTEGGSLNVPRIVGHIQETLTALRESHAFGVAMSDKYVASRAPECAAAQEPVAWATPSLLVTLSAVEKNHLTNPDRRTRGGEFESAAADAERYSVPLYAAPPASEPQTAAARDVLVERARQVGVEGWTPEHDDQHDGMELAFAASCYAVADEGEPPDAIWPWPIEWWKPRSHRENLVRAGALILAEIERLDRAARIEESK